MIVWDPISKIGMDGEGKGVVLPLTISALLAEVKENTMPSYVTAVPAGQTVWLPIAKPVGAAVII